MELEIKSIIEKNLPAQVGDVLKQRLAKADADAAQVKSLFEAIEGKNAYIQQLSNKLNEYTQFDNRNAGIEAREKMVADAERNLRISMLECQLVAEKEKTDFTKSVALGLVRNTEYRKSISNCSSIPMRDNGYTTYESGSENINEIKSVE